MKSTKNWQLQCEQKNCKTHDNFLLIKFYSLNVFGPIAMISSVCLIIARNRKRNLIESMPYRLAQCLLL